MTPKLRAFLGRLRERPETPVHDEVLLEWYGKDLLGQLRGLGLFVEAGLADWYPCPGTEEGCPRTVHRDFLPNKDKPHYAACCNGRGCMSMPVADDDLRMSRLSWEPMFGLLQRLLGLPEAPPRREPGLRQGWLLGKQQAPGGPREVVLDLSMETRTLGLAMAERRRLFRQALVLLPLLERTPAEVLSAYAAGEPVEMAFLEDCLTLVEGGFRWVGAEPGENFPAAGQAGPAYCLAYRGKGAPEELSEEAYREEVARKGEYDLFIDLTAQVRRHYLAGWRDRRGRSRKAELTPEEARVLATLMQKGQPMRASALRKGEDGDHVKFVSRARAKVDACEGREDWRWFHSAASDLLGDKEFVFRPPQGAMCLLLVKPADRERGPNLNR